MAGLLLMLPHVVGDVLCIMAALYVTLRRGSPEWILWLTLAARIASAGWTGRWSVSLFLVPVVVLQRVRRYSTDNKWLFYVATVLSVLIIAVSGLLSHLFPPVTLPSMEGPYYVGVRYAFLASNSGINQCTLPEDHQVAVKVLYPTLDDRPRQMSYLEPSTAMEYCRATMQFGAPPPLKKLDWMMHYLKLIYVQAIPDAKPLADRTFPVIVYSHGLGGHADTYWYQTLKLAAEGYIVVVVTHSDGSAAVAPTPDGGVVDYDFGNVSGLSGVDYVRARRQQASHRASEVMAVAEHLDDLQLPIDRERIYLIGHSFGATTALTTAKRRPDLCHGVVAHEPAMDWLPDDARHSFFHPSRLQILEGDHDYDHGTGGYEQDVQNEDDMHYYHNMLVLFSWEWREKGWAWTETIEKLYKNRRIGPQDGVSEVVFIQDAHHSEFADTCMLTPLWLARSVGLTGPRDPTETAKEIHERTLTFLRKLEERHKSQ